MVLWKFSVFLSTLLSKFPSQMVTKKSPIRDQIIFFTFNSGFNRKRQEASQEVAFGNISI